MTSAANGQNGQNGQGKGSHVPLVNPYIVGNPIVNRNLFFGREDDFAFIRNKVTGSGTGGILVLCGTRRSGKSSSQIPVPVSSYT
jgi:hypothetical protein